MCGVDPHSEINSLDAKNSISNLNGMMKNTRRGRKTGKEREKSEYEAPGFESLAGGIRPTACPSFHCHLSIQSKSEAPYVSVQF